MMSSEEETEALGMHEKAALKQQPKPKRTRQRVDAGEPRNSYASIPNFSSRPPQPGGIVATTTGVCGSAAVPLSSYQNGLSMPTSANGNNNSTKVLGDVLGTSRTGKHDPDMLLDLGGSAESQGPRMNGTESVLRGQSPSTTSFLNGNDMADFSPLGYARSPGSDSNAHLLRDILQQGSRKLSPPAPTKSPMMYHLSGRPASGSHALQTPPDSEQAAREAETDDSKGSGRMSEQQRPLLSRSPSPCTTPTAACSPSASPVRPATTSGTTSLQEVKRARVETIVSNMMHGPGTRSPAAQPAAAEPPAPVNGCKKRKLYQPQQHEASRANGLQEDEEDDEDEEDMDEMDDMEGQAATGEGAPQPGGQDEEEVTAPPPAKQRRLERDYLRKQLEQMQAQLISMQRRYWELYEGEISEPDTPREAASPGSDDARASSVVAMETRRPVRLSPECGDQDTEVDEAPEKVETPVSQSSDPGAPPSPKMSSSEPQSDVLTASTPYAEEARREPSADGRLRDSSRPPEHRQSCIVRPNSLHPPNSTASDLEWFIDVLKRDVQTTVIQIIDASFARYLQTCSSKAAAAVDAAVDTPSSRELTVLSQMLHDRKSPRTKVIDRGGGGGGGGGGRVNGHGPLGPRSSPFPDAASTPKNNNVFYPPPFKPSSASHMFCGPPTQNLPPVSIAQHFGHPPTSQMGPMGTSSGLNGPDVPEQTEAMSLVVAPKKKRHKVTDTRITPRTVSRVLGQDQEGSPKYPLLGLTPSEQGPSPAYPHHPPPPPLVPVSLPTTVAIPNPSLHNPDIFTGLNFPEHPRLGHYVSDPQDDDSLLHSSNQSSFHPNLLGAHGSPDSLHFSHFKQENGEGSDTGDPPGYDSGLALTSTLTPMHLRKAKLMFFYVRYPSSSILKMYFPDIKFNKNNTAQLVKWFSNFREFYYIQMEKYARQALSEGVKNPEDLRVSADSELLRVLNLHYNRNNHIEVPENFRYVVENTLREFFKAIVAGKDQEQSWKKAIYKVIARLDDNVPEYFKSPNFLEQLE